ncbi:MAG: cysteine desulfurase NifS [Oscillospiraceae bacterium]|nr:cysteine desulfurase NifS [Oscillospiraceae bacterium]MBQ4315992.1 cysteine desulfurase NifS [Oscillospiraceae bacterium]MBQ6698727.1 cysteine desulfurase NifS [Oscillospiraceae bacterium]
MYKSKFIFQGGIQMIYADNSATTRTKPEVLDKMLPYFTEHYGNPSSLYAFAYDAKRAVENAREEVAKVIGARGKEIFFTSCGSESDNWVLRGVTSKLRDKGNHIITSCIEHPAIMETCKQLEKQGIRVTYLPVDEYGSVSVDDLKAAICDETILISIMTANNEIGTIQPIREIGAIAKEKEIFFHTDAVQAYGHIPINVDEMNIDFLSLSGHKIGAPKGIGALYIRSGIRIDNLIYGGGQEKRRRAGTENVPYIVALGEAARLANEHMSENIARLTKMRDALIERVLKIPYTRLTGHPTNRLPGLCSIVIEGIEGEALLLNMFNEGICASSGSACSSGSLDPSHVLLSIGLPHHIAHGSLRLSLGEDNAEGDEIKIAEAVEKVAAKLRAMSPVWENGKPVWEE